MSWSCGTSGEPRGASGASCCSRTPCTRAATSLTSLGVLVSLAGVRLGFPILDPLSGLAVAIVIARTGYQIARETSHILSDRIVIADDDLRDVVLSVPGVLGCHRIRTRGAEDHVFLDMHVWMSAETRLDEAHRLSHVVKDRLMERYPQIVDAIIHIEPPPDRVH